MADSLLAEVISTFKSGILHTTKEKWIDGSAVALTIAYQFFLGKPITFWEGAEPYVWLLCLIFAVHLVKATREVWKQISQRPTVQEVESPILRPDASKNKRLVSTPRPPYFRHTLVGILLILLMLLLWPCYLVRHAAITSLRTYAYLVPAAELIECQKRAFFIKTVGPQILYNAEIDPSLRPSSTYFWFTPSSRWDEDYTVTVASRESNSSQRLLLRSTQHQLQFATQVTTDGEKTPALRCRDKLLPESYTLAAGENRSCSEPMKLTGDVPIQLDVSSYESADGNFAVRRVKELPSPSELDEQSDERHITEFQHQIIEPVLGRYSGSQVRIYFAGGPKSNAYAEEFRTMFAAKGWRVKGPVPVPVGDERIIDVQVSANYRENWNKDNPKLHDVLNSFEKAGIKQRNHPSLDPKVATGLIVLWIGPRSPKDVNPNQCSPAGLEPRPGEPHTCEIIAQIQGSCPFVPQ
jgi:hypothetical protein